MKLHVKLHDGEVMVPVDGNVLNVSPKEWKTAASRHLFARLASPPTNALEEIRTR